MYNMILLRGNSFKLNLQHFHNTNKNQRWFKKKSKASLENEEETYQYDTNALPNIILTA